MIAVPAAPRARIARLAPLAGALLLVPALLGAQAGDTRTDAAPAAAARGPQLAPAALRLPVAAASRAERLTPPDSTVAPSQRLNVTLMLAGAAGVVLGVLIKGKIGLVLGVGGALVGALGLGSYASTR